MHVMPCSLVGYVMGLAGMDAGTVLAGNSRAAQALWSFITNTRISLYFLQARVETRRWNSVHGSLLSRLKRSTLRSWLDDMYGLGFVVCTLTMSVVLPLLLWTSWTLFKSLTIPKAPRLVRREATLTPIVSM